MNIFRFVLPAMLVLSAGTASGFETERYKSIVGQTISAINSGNFEVQELIDLQDSLIAIGVQGVRDFGASNPKHAELMALVENSVGEMKEMSLDEIEAAWHEGEALSAIGLNFDEIDYFGPAVSYMDTVVHAATALVALREYAATQDDVYLDQVVDELSEVVEHVENLN